MAPDTSSTSSQRSQRYGLTAWSRTRAAEQQVQNAPLEKLRTPQPCPWAGWLCGRDKANGVQPRLAHATPMPRASPWSRWCTPWLSIKHWSGRVGLAKGQAADTHTSWIQLHGTGVRPALTALGGNFVCKSEIKRGKAAPEQDMNTNFETAAGGGVYT